VFIVPKFEDKMKIRIALAASVSILVFSAVIVNAFAENGMWQLVTSFVSSSGPDGSADPQDEAGNGLEISASLGQEVESAAPSPPQADQTKPAGTWVFFSDSSYSLIPCGTADPILFKQLQGPDYAEAMNSDLLTDKNMIPESKEFMNKIEKDPLISRVDNLLPDGRYLKSDWVNIYNGLLDERREMRTLKSEKPVVNQWSFAMDTIEGPKEQKMLDILSDGKTVAVTAGGEGQISANEKTYLCNEIGIWELGAGGAMEKISKESYNGKSWAELAQLASEAEYQLTWNAELLINPSARFLTYVSSKNDVSTPGRALFLYDLAKREERLIYDRPDANVNIWDEIYPLGFVDDLNVLCRLTNGRQEETFVLVNLNDGTATDIALEKSAWVLSVKEGLIAYAIGELGSEVVISKCDSKGNLEEVARSGMGARTIGVASVSPAAEKFACLYTRDAYSLTERKIRLLDLFSNYAFDIDLEGVDTYENAFISRFWWIDEKSILVNIKGKLAGADAECTYIYHLGYIG
jgi:hypothetical protein